MRNLTKTLLLFILIAVIICSCEDDKTTPDYSLKFIGKWDLIGSGNGTQIDYFDYPSRSWEFKEDSLIFIYIYSLNKTYTAKYWLESQLVLQTPSPDGIPLIEKFEYQFYNDTMRLDRASGFYNENVYIFKKVNK